MCFILSKISRTVRYKEKCIVSESKNNRGINQLSSRVQLYFDKKYR